MAKAVHSMLRVLDEQRSTTFYETALGLTLADRIDFDSFTLIYLRNPETEFELELTVNKDRKEPYNLGDGYGHNGRRLGKFFFLQDPDGYKIEVIERGGRFR